MPALLVGHFSELFVLRNPPEFQRFDREVDVLLRRGDEPKWDGSRLLEPLRGEVVVWKVSVRSIAAAISEACKVKRRLPHEYPPQKRKSLLTHTHAT